MDSGKKEEDTGSKTLSKIISYVVTIFMYNPATCLTCIYDYLSFFLWLLAYHIDMNISVPIINAGFSDKEIDFLYDTIKKVSLTALMKIFRSEC